MTTRTPPTWAGWTFRDDAEREQTRTRLARLLVRQAGLLRHAVDPDVQAAADRPLPEDRLAS